MGVPVKPANLQKRLQRGADPEVNVPGSSTGFIGDSGKTGQATTPWLCQTCTAKNGHRNQVCYRCGNSLKRQAQFEGKQGSHKATCKDPGKNPDLRCLDNLGVSGSKNNSNQNRGVDVDSILAQGRAATKEELAALGRQALEHIRHVGKRGQGSARGKVHSRQ